MDCFDSRWPQRINFKWIRYALAHMLLGYVPESGMLEGRRGMIPGSMREVRRKDDITTKNNNSSTMMVIHPRASRRTRLGVLRVSKVYFKDYIHSAKEDACRHNQHEYG